MKFFDKQCGIHNLALTHPFLPLNVFPVLIIYYYDKHLLSAGQIIIPLHCIYLILLAEKCRQHKTASSGRGNPGTAGFKF